ncbi:hypothetical protein CA51_12770 [Rosistilla oblonga]|uniref:lysylphosphatidylglycerol synthase domain-containing protein n=1 Tax=Rosistilla oblonga TaxID=2527990 RepID=UPI001187AA7C|nr:lysylphosphatidylglycerol synthase domain-containing protein [Rosistilla oblonga]QDV11414.1 hypothetical protein CA51_12770 [Rosistilla oblonga]
MLLRIAKFAIALAVVVGLTHTIRSAAGELAEHRDRIRGEIADLDQQLQSATDPAARADLQARRERWVSQQPRLAAIDWWRVAAAAAVYLASLFPAALFFHQVLCHMKQRPRLGDAVRAHILGHMGKYVPGKAMVVVLRTGAIAGPNVRAGVAVVAAFIETLLMMAVGGTVAGVFVVCLRMPTGITLLAIGLAACAAVPTLPSLFRFVVRKISESRFGSDKGLDDAGIDWRLIGCGWGWMLLMWTAIGWSFALLIQATPGAMVDAFTWQDYMLATAAIALAMVAGFISLLPGGAGVRELVLSTLLAPRFGLVPALVAAILARLVFLAVEVGIGGLLWTTRRRTTPGDRSRCDTEDLPTG